MNIKQDRLYMDNFGNVWRASFKNASWGGRVSWMCRLVHMLSDVFELHEGYTTRFTSRGEHRFGTVCVTHFPSNYHDDLYQDLSLVKEITP